MDHGEVRAPPPSVTTGEGVTAHCRTAVGGAAERRRPDSADPLGDRGWRAAVLPPRPTGEALDGGEDGLEVTVRQCLDRAPSTQGALARVQPDLDALVGVDVAELVEEVLQVQQAVPTRWAGSPTAGPVLHRPLTGPGDRADLGEGELAAADPADRAEAARVLRDTEALRAW